MRIVSFAVQQSLVSGMFEAQSQVPLLQITAGSIEELHHEARDALIEHLGDRHVAYRVQLRVGSL